MTALTFLSPQWLAETENVLHNRITPEMTHYANTSILTIFEACPDGSEKALLVEINKGSFTRIALQSKPYPAAEFVVTGHYHVFLRVLKGEVEPTAALMSGQLNFQGNMLRALGMMAVIEPFYKVLGEIPSEFE